MYASPHRGQISAGMPERTMLTPSRVRWSSVVPYSVVAPQLAQVLRVSDWAISGHLFAAPMLVYGRGKGMTQTQITAKKAALPPIAQRWKSSWKPKTRGKG